MNIFSNLGYGMVLKAGEAGNGMYRIGGTGTMQNV